MQVFTYLAPANRIPLDTLNCASSASENVYPNDHLTDGHHQIITNQFGPMKLGSMSKIVAKVDE